MTSRTLKAASSSPRPPTFFNTLASEWSKLAALRSTYVMLGLGVFLSIATTALSALAIGATKADLPDNFDPVTISMIGTIFGLIVFSVFGVLAASREYSSGMIRLTLIATPSRGRVLFAKFVLVGLTILVAGMITTVGMFFAGQAVLGAYGLPTASLSDGDTQHMVFGLGAAMVFFPTLGLAFGVLLRSTAGGITTVMGLLWLPQVVGQLVPRWSQEHVLSLLPSNGVDSMTVGHMQNDPAYSAPAIGAVIAASWLLAVVGAAYLAFIGRDA
jgi:ABC-type transport system involved in multi-copper enzyme maturation permease subunit